MAAILVIAIAFGLLGAGLTLAFGGTVLMAFLVYIGSGIFGLLLPFFVTAFAERSKNKHFYPTFPKWPAA